MSNEPKIEGDPGSVIRPLCADEWQQTLSLHVTRITLLDESSYHKLAPPGSFPALDC